MGESASVSASVMEYRQHFDQYFLGAIPKLLNDEGTVLAFVSMLTAIECMAGLFEPSKNSGDRFRAFIREYFPAQYSPLADELWCFRNLLIHAFNPMPFRIGCHQSRVHLLDLQGALYLNAEDFYADVIQASRKYFQNLSESPQLQSAFAKRVADKVGGSPKAYTFIESVSTNGPAV